MSLSSLLPTPKYGNKIERSIIKEVKEVKVKETIKIPGHGSRKKK